MELARTINSNKRDEVNIRPLETAAGVEFAEQILTDLVKEGLSGKELVSEFQKRQAQIRPAAEALLAKAEDIAAGKAEYATYDDVFGAKD